LGQALFETQPRFRASIERCEEILRRLLAEPQFSIHYGTAPETGLLPQSHHADLSLFTLEYGLAELWLSWGIEPVIVAGLGVGQYAAACLAGLFDLEVALSLVLERARLQSGEEDPQRLASFARSVTEKMSASARFRMLAMSDADVTTAEYWVEALTLTPKPSDLVEPLRREVCDLYLEVGPGRSITHCLEAEFPGDCLSSLRQETGEWEQLLESLARLYVRGAAVDWFGFDRGYLRHRVSLPTYPFQRKRYWITDIETPEPDSPDSSLADVNDMTRAIQRYDWPVAGCLDEVEHLSEQEVRLRLSQFAAEDQNEDELAALSEIRSRLAGMSASRQELFIRMLDYDLQRLRKKGANGSRASPEQATPLTDAELDQLSESEAEALLLKKLESLKF
jgi:acyl transferase domain-containing protein